MQGNHKKSFLRMASFSVAAFVLCFAFAGATQLAAAKAVKKVVKKKAPVAEADAAPAPDGAGDLPPRMKPAEGGDEA